VKTQVPVGAPIGFVPQNRAATPSTPIGFVSSTTINPLVHPSPRCTVLHKGAHPAGFVFQFGFVPQNRRRRNAPRFEEPSGFRPATGPSTARVRFLKSPRPQAGPDNLASFPQNRAATPSASVGFVSSTTISPLVHPAPRCTVLHKDAHPASFVFQIGFVPQNRRRQRAPRFGDPVRSCPATPAGFVFQTPRPAPPSKLASFRKSAHTPPALSSNHWCRMELPWGGAAPNVTNCTRTTPPHLQLQ
jgi:hypothetical protein